jgi:hypothetical protein
MKAYNESDNCLEIDTVLLGGKPFILKVRKNE